MPPASRVAPLTCLFPPGDLGLLRGECGNRITIDDDCKITHVAFLTMDVNGLLDDTIVMSMKC